MGQCAHAWDAASPSWVCGFAVSRGVAEALLAERPPGAFLIRLCSEPGAFAVSCHVAGGPAGGGPGGEGGGGGGGAGFVDHLLVDAVDLAGQPLEAWVLAHAAATHLLDPATARLLPKARACLMQASEGVILKAVKFSWFMICIPCHGKRRVP